MESKTETTVYASDGEAKTAVEALARQLSVTLCYEEPDRDSGKPFLFLTETGLSLVSGTLSIQGDFSRMLPRLKQRNLGGELLIRAAKIKSLGPSPVVIDATAGLGEDAFLLAAAGFTVTMYERNRTVALLLADALRRALLSPVLSETAKRMCLLLQDSIEALPLLSQSPALVLLDPMFPERRKSALVKKKFQLIHLLEEPCTDEQALLTAALSAHPKKIIVKRPSKGPFLCGRKPDYSIEGNGIRYDCLLPKD